MIKFLQLLRNLCFLLLLVHVSCRQEETLYEGTEPQERLVADSNVARLLTAIAAPDTVSDDILDGSPCISIVLPVSVTVNSERLTISEPSDYDRIQELLDFSDDDEDVIHIDFPIKVMVSNLLTRSVGNQTAFDNIVVDCNEEAAVSERITCVDVQYPITFKVFNRLTENLSDISIQNDADLLSFIAKINENQIVEPVFPQIFEIGEDAEFEANSLEETEKFITENQDNCQDEVLEDEFDDDYE